MMNQSEKIGKLVEALCKAQTQFDPIIKDVKAHHHKYAPLDACLNATRAPLCNNGLVVIQTMEMTGGKSILVTTLAHTSGEFIKSYMDLSDLKMEVKGINPLHSWGSIITYTRRYAYLLIIQAIGENEDNDGVDVKPRNLSHETYKNFKKQTELSPVEKLVRLITSSGCDVSEFTKFHNLSSNDLVSVQLAVVNFNEYLKSFRNYPKGGHNESESDQSS